jgi:hypothetical protein
MPRKVFTAGEVLAASDVNSFLMDQSVMSFAGTAARGSAIPTPVEGMVTYLEDTDSLQMFNGSAYTNVANTGRGILSYQAATANTAISANTELTLFTSTVTILPGRLYEFFGAVTYQASSTTNQKALYINSSGLSNKTLFYDTAGMVLSNFNITMEGSAIFTSTAIGVTSGTGTSTTFYLRLKTGSAGVLNVDPDGYVGSGSSEQQFIIRDVGAM